MSCKSGTAGRVYSSTIQILSKVSPQKYIDLATQNNVSELHYAYIIFAGKVFNNGGLEIESATVTIRLFDNET